MKNDTIFWDRNLNKKEVKEILNDEAHQRFVDMAALVLSRSDNPKIAFTEYIDIILFCRNWNKIKRKMRRNKWSDKRIIFWNQVYKVAMKNIDKNKLKSSRQKPTPLNFEMEKIGNIIKAARIKKGLTQKQLAEDINMSQQTVSFIERGLINITIMTLKRIFVRLDLSIAIVDLEKGNIPI